MKIEITDCVSDRKIPAIKFLRDATTTPDGKVLGLKEAKEIVEAGAGTVDIVNTTLWRAGADEYFRWVPVDVSSGFIGRVMDFASDYHVEGCVDKKVIRVVIAASGDSIYSAMASLKSIFKDIMEDKNETD